MAVTLTLCYFYRAAYCNTTKLEEKNETASCTQLLTMVGNGFFPVMDEIYKLNPGKDLKQKNAVELSTMDIPCFYTR